MGIPLGLSFASKNFDVTLVDVNPKAVENINRAHLPFKEDGAEELLEAHDGKNLRETADREAAGEQGVVVGMWGFPSGSRSRARTSM